jgi:hypothetical protein
VSGLKKGKPTSEQEAAFYRIIGSNTGGNAAVLLSIKVLAQQPTDLTYAATQVVNKDNEWVGHSSDSGKRNVTTVMK